jgi:PAS domain S-box-containing protein
LRRKAVASKGFAQSEMLLAQAEQLADVGSWELDVKRQRLAWSPHFCQMLGFEPRKVRLHAWCLRFIHPDDRERAKRDFEALVLKGTPLDNESRFVTEGGALRIFHSRAVAIANKRGEVVFIRGMSQDITESRMAEIKLHEREGLLSHAEEVASLGSWEFDVGSVEPRLSKNLRQIYGLSANETFTRDIYTEHVHPKDRARVGRIIDEAVAKCQHFEYGLRYILPTGETRFLFTRGTPIAGPDGKSARVIGVVQDVTELKHAQEERQRIWRQMTQGRDEERRRMARELHESAGQSLAALKMNLGQLYESLPRKRSLAGAFWQSSTELVEQAIREVRTVSYLMHPPLLDEAGLAPALRWYVRGFAERSKIAATVEIADDFGRVSREVETTVFRVVQEALTNVHRYSGSNTARIRVSREDGHFLAEVRDEGCGLAVMGGGASSQAATGVGIAGMRERVQHLNGAFEIESAPGRGTTVRATLPVGGSAENNPEDLAHTEMDERRKASLLG